MPSASPAIGPSTAAKGNVLVAFLNRYLDPAESLAEILFGLIMVLTCTLGASLLAGSERESLRTTLVAALGCNVAWGVIDAALYVMGNIFVRSRNSRLLQAIRSTDDEAEALAIVRQALEPRVGAYGHREDRELLYRSMHRIIAHGEAMPGTMTIDDIRGAFAVFVLVVGAAIPSAIPYVLIGDPLVALRVVNIVQVALLFVVGFHWARSIGGHAWRTGLVMMFAGVMLVAVAISLGG